MVFDISVPFTVVVLEAVEHYPLRNVDNNPVNLLI